MELIIRIILALFIGFNLSCIASLIVGSFIVWLCKIYDAEENDKNETYDRCI